MAFRVLVNLILAPQLSGKKYIVTGRNHYLDVEVQYGDRVFLNREPWNKHDKNAIAVLNTNCRVIGHLRAKDAAKIAPYLDYTTCIWGRLGKSAHGVWNTNILIDS